MTTDLTLPQRAIVMKSGLVLWVAQDRAEKLENILAGSEGHRFVKIDDKTINSAEIEGVYSPEKYEDLQKVKRGMWQCPFLQWHKKMEECECKQDVQKKREFVERATKRLATEEMDEITRESVLSAVQYEKDWLEKRGVTIHT